MADRSSIVLRWWAALVGWIRSRLVRRERARERLQENAPELKPGRLLRSALNGFMGDGFRRRQHPFAITMKVVDQNGNRIVLSERHRNSRKGTVLFVHGLCCSEQEWQSKAITPLLVSLTAQGYQVAWLRYNTGLPIWENGVQLSGLLHQQLGNDLFRKRRLVLIGHSMGGLVIRSACYHARHYFKLPWIRTLTHAAYLASPHSGAPLARLSQRVHSAVKTLPFGRSLRPLRWHSQGIHSLQDGQILAPGLTQGDVPLPFNDRVQHLLIGARMNHKNRAKWWGDGLVQEDSALGWAHFPNHPTVQRVVLDEVSHTRLLRDDRTYQILSNWLLHGS